MYYGGVSAICAKQPDETLLVLQIVLPEISEQVLYVSAPSDSPLLGALAGSERVTERGTKAFYCFLDELSNEASQLLRKGRESYAAS